ncbi:MAG: AbrB/MazE/SpoVT family DNA-binding domain-containing protein [Bacillota bacterium]|nr:AbrB/MazE/SpoVT family DNA-binding domain-containing protein [Bacillota bacterium]
MKSTSIVRKVDNLGRIVIPKEVRQQLYIDEGDFVEVFVNEREKSIIVKRYSTGCIFCGSIENLSNFKKQLICKHCLSDLIDNK